MSASAKAASGVFSLGFSHRLLVAIAADLCDHLIQDG
jgi:hypothetical protein